MLIHLSGIDIWQSTPETNAVLLPPLREPSPEDDEFDILLSDNLADSVLLAYDQAERVGFLDPPIPTPPQTITRSVFACVHLRRRASPGIQFCPFCGGKFSSRTIFEQPFVCISRVRRLLCVASDAHPRGSPAPVTTVASLVERKLACLVDTLLSNSLVS